MKMFIKRVALKLLILVSIISALPVGLIKTSAAEDQYLFWTFLLYGDVNGDGIIDSVDAGRVVDYENWLVNWDRLLI